MSLLSMISLLDNTNRLHHHLIYFEILQKCCSSITQVFKEALDETKESVLALQDHQNRLRVVIHQHEMKKLVNIYAQNFQKRIADDM